MVINVNCCFLDAYFSADVYFSPMDVTLAGCYFGSPMVEPFTRSWWLHFGTEFACIWAQGPAHVLPYWFSFLNPSYSPRSSRHLALRKHSLHLLLITNFNLSVISGLVTSESLCAVAVWGTISIDSRSRQASIQLQDLPPCNAEKLGKPWMMPVASGIHSPSAANPTQVMSVGTFTALWLAPLFTEITLS